LLTSPLHLQVGIVCSIRLQEWRDHSLRFHLYLLPFFAKSRIAYDAAEHQSQVVTGRCDDIIHGLLTDQFSRRLACDLMRESGLLLLIE
jgi:hypothetical protein